MNARRSLASNPALLLVALALVVLGAAAAAFGPSVFPNALMRDFNAFYCAGHAANAGADPYLAEPLGSCERMAHGFSLQSGTNGLAMPAPIPPYALLPFMLLAHLPYEPAALVWTIVIALCVAATVVAMRRVTGLPWPVLLAAFALTDWYASACLGQIAPVAVAALAVATALANEGRGAQAGLAVSVAMIEPHLGLASCVGLFLRVRAARLPMLGAGFVYAALSIALTGTGLTLEYFRRVVPAHALSEVMNEKQFSFTHALAVLGVPEATAVHAGELQFAITAAAGILAGLALAQRLRDDGLAVAVPAAFAVVGGPFMHVVQMAAASVAALALYRYATPVQRRFLALALVMLAVPWMQFSNLGTIFPLLAPIAVGVLAWHFFGPRPLPLAAFATSAALYPMLLANLLVERLADPVPRLVAAYDPHALAEASWSLYVHLVATPNAGAYELAKAPTLFGVLAVAGVAAAQALVPLAAARPRQAIGAADPAA